MSRYVAIDLNQLPFPEIIGPLAYEDILAQLKADVVALAPSLASALAVEGDPVQAVLQAIAYRALVHEARFNDIARSAYLSTATGADLDNLVAEYGVQRMVIEPADLDAVPPTPAVNRRRTAQPCPDRAGVVLDGRPAGCL
jgi:phage-related baseplate assembly protein